MTRTGSIGSAVPPALTTMVRPDRSPVAPQGVGDVAQQFRRFQQPPPAGQTGSQPPPARPGDDCPSLPQPFQVLLRRRVLVHIGVHGRGHHQRGLDATTVVVSGSSAMPIASLAMVWTVAGATTMTLGLPRQLHVFHGVLGISVEGVGDHRAMGEAAEGQRSNELRRPVGHYGVHQRSGLCQLAGQVESLVAGNAAGDAQYHSLAA